MQASSSTNSSLDLILRCTFDTPCTGTVFMPEYQGIHTVPPQRLRGGEDHPILVPELQRTDGHIINTYSVHTTYYILERACCIASILGCFSFADVDTVSRFGVPVTFRFLLSEKRSCSVRRHYHSTKYIIPCHLRMVYGAMLVLAS